ncbi:ash family protein, partial [Escherichia coli]|uniref:ash family protein n=1 Tax=Escherichia coli TaxID=562 RepID=UPI00289CAD7C
LKVAAKSAAGRRNPCYLKAILHAPGVFFCVAALTHLKFMVWWLIVFFYFLRHIIRIMVVQAGQLSGWPVSFRAGIPTPVWATTHERRNSGGGIYRYLLEVALMATILAPSHPQFIFVFAAVRRAERKPRISM